LIANVNSFHFDRCTGLLTNLIKEKNTKVKEMIKLLHIEPIVNYFAHGIRYERKNLIFVSKLVENLVHWLFFSFSRYS